MLDPGLDPSLAARARALDVDWRQAWCGAGDDGVVRAWPASAATELEVDALQAHGSVRLTTVLEPGRAEPAHRAEMITEFRGGEHLTALVRRGDWWVIAGEDGYVAWVHDWVVAEAHDDGPWLGRFALPHGTLWIADHHAGAPLMMGTPLHRPDEDLVARTEWRLVRTPTGAVGWIEAEHIEATTDPSMAAVLRRSRSLLGVPYRWGGRSPLGFDCSGLVQFVFGLGGYALPRDASQQQHVGQEVPLERDAWERGDLLFFGEPADHVGIFDGKASLLHCRASVVKQDLDAIGPLMERLTSVRRVGARERVSRASGWIRPADA